MRVKFAGGRAPAAITGQHQLTGKTNYFIGNDPKQWHTNVPNYSAVEYHSIYSGVDAVFHGNNRQLEFDFDLAPGADPHVVCLEVEGAQRIYLNDAGDVVLALDAKRVVVMGKPRIYQQSPEGQREIAGHFVLSAGNRIAFALGSYDHKQPLVIDPTLAYSSYLGGSTQDLPYAIAADASGSAYVAGRAYSPDFPVTTGAYQTSCKQNGATNCSQGSAYVSKFTPDGSGLVYSTFLNGTSGGDGAFGIAVDSAGAAYITGVEQGELDFPTTTGAIQAPCNIAANLQPEIFVAKLDPTGSTLVYSTCLLSPAVNSSNQFSQGSSFSGGIAVDLDGNAYVTGYTDLPENFPTNQSTFQPTCVPDPPESCKVSEDPFLVKINPTGTSLVYSTFLSNGVVGSDVQTNGIAVDPLGNAYVIGYDFDYGDVLTTPGSFLPTCSTCGGFLLKINGNATVLVYGTFLGGSEGSTPTAVAVDQSGDAFVTGFTTSTDFPVTVGVLQYYFTPLGSPTTNGGDGFVAKVGAAGDTYAYATFLGGTSQGTVPGGIGVDLAGNAYVTGTALTGFPTTPDAFQTALPAGNSSYQAFFCRLDPIGATLLYSTFMAGANGETINNPVGATGLLAVDIYGNAYVTGQTTSTDFPTTADAFQPQSPISGATQSGTGFVAKFLFPTSLNISPSTIPSGTVGAAYGPVTLTATGGSGTVTFAVTAGLMPQVLTLTPAGVLSGTPTQSGSFSFTVTATDSNGDTGSQSYSLTIAAACSAIAVGPSTLAGGTVGTSYQAVTFTATGGTGTITFSETGTLPAGMTFASGVLSGTPTQSGTFPIMVTATDQNGCTGSVSPTLTINPAATINTTTTITSTSSSFKGLPLPTNVALVGNPVTVIFKVQPGTGTAPATGSVNVSDSFKDSCPATLTSTSAGTGSCALTVSQLGSGSTPLVAAYSPDANSSGLLPSTSSPFMENLVQIANCGKPPSEQTAVQGTTVTFTLSVCLARDVQAVPTAVASNCPTDAVCNVNITPVPNQVGVYTVVVTITLGGTGSGVLIQEPSPRGGPWPLTVFSFGMLLALASLLQLARQYGVRPRRQWAAASLLFAAMLFCSIAGCSGNGKPETPPSTYTVNVTVTVGTYSTTVPLTVIVTK